MSNVVLNEVHGKVGLIRINRPEAMNALNNEVVDGIAAAIDAFEADENIGCIVLTGSRKGPAGRRQRLPAPRASKTAISTSRAKR